MVWRVLLATAMLAGLANLTAAAAAPPRRIVSLNLCTDEILIDLVPRERIVALSHLAADPLVSPVAGRVGGITLTRGEAEEVLALEPDLVLAAGFSTPATLGLLERLGRNVVRIPQASDIDGIRRAIRQVAAAVGADGEGEALVRTFDRRLAVARSDVSQRPAASAMIYQVNGLSAGPGSLADALIGAAGLVNHATTIGLGPSGALPLELLVAEPPDIVVLSGPADEYRTVVAENLRHPALRSVLASHASVTVPWRLWLCGTQHAAEAVELLAAARRRLAAKASAP